MRVGQFLAHYPSPGGSTSVLQGLSSGLIDLGHDVVIYGHGTPDGPALEDAEERIVANPRISRRGLAVLAPPDALWRSLSRNEDSLDVLIIHGMFSPFSPRIARAARKGGVPTIAQPHDPYSPAVFHERRLAKSLYWRLLERPFLQNVDAIQLYAPSHRQHLVRLGVDTRTFVVPAGLSQQSLERAAAARHAKRRSQEAVNLVFLGRFDIHNKGLDLLFEAIAATSSLRSGVRLECRGARSRPEFDAVTGMVQHFGLTDCIHVSLRSDNPWSSVALADLLVLPSRFDGFALVALEALAAGTPIVLSNAAGVAEYIGDDEAVVIAEPSVEGVRDGLLDAVARLNELQAAASNASERISSRLTWSHSAEQWLQSVMDLGLLVRRNSEPSMVIAR